jgi:hypothetical protein
MEVELDMVITEVVLTLTIICGKEAAAEVLAALVQILQVEHVAATEQYVEVVQAGTQKAGLVENLQIFLHLVHQDGLVVVGEESLKIMMALQAGCIPMVEQVVGETETRQALMGLVAEEAEITRMVETGL